MKQLAAALLVATAGGAQACQCAPVGTTSITDAVAEVMQADAAIEGASVCAISDPAPRRLEVCPNRARAIMLRPEPGDRPIITVVRATRVMFGPRMQYFVVVSPGLGSCAWATERAGLPARLLLRLHRDDRGVVGRLKRLLWPEALRFEASMCSGFESDYSNLRAVREAVRRRAANE